MQDLSKVSGLDHLDYGMRVLQEMETIKYEFILGEEEGIGKYQMCFLFSPAEIDEDSPSLKERMETSVSRREMLRGNFLLGKSEQD